MVLAYRPALSAYQSNRTCLEAWMTGSGICASVITLDPEKRCSRLASVLPSYQLASINWRMAHSRKTTPLPLLTTGAAFNMATTRVLLMVWSRPTSTADYLVPGMSAADFPLDEPTCWKPAMMGCLSCMTSLCAPHSCVTNLQVDMYTC